MVAVAPAARLFLLEDIATVGKSASVTGGTKASKSSCESDGTVVLPIILTILLLKSVPVPAPFINTYPSVLSVKKTILLVIEASFLIAVTVLLMLELKVKASDFNVTPAMPVKVILSPASKALITSNAESVLSVF